MILYKMKFYNLINLYFHYKYFIVNGYLILIAFRHFLINNLK
jgi:hypothetical protein